MKHMRLLAVITTVLMSATVWAQPGPEGLPPGMEPPPDGGPMGGPHSEGSGLKGPHERGPGSMPPGRGGPAEEDLRSLLQSVMMARVSRALEMSEEETVLLVRRFSEHQDAMMGLRKKRHGLMRDLHEAIEQGADEATINEKLNAVIALDEEAATAPGRLLESAGKGLSAAQRAKLYTILLEFESDLRGMVMRAKERRGFDGRPPGFRGRGGQDRGNGPGGDYVPPPEDPQESGSGSATKEE